MKTKDKAAFEDYQPEDKYAAAGREVKRLKGFYSHLIAYVFVNIIIVFINIYNLKEGESYFKMENFFTAFFWGIGLAAHGLSVFGRNVFFGKKWEERKIQELMKRDQNSKWE
jgi:hypothetical protein